MRVALAALGCVLFVASTVRAEEASSSTQVSAATEESVGQEGSAAAEESVSKEASAATEASDTTKSEKELAAIFRYPLFLRFHGGIGFAQRAKQGDGISFAGMGGVQLMLPANATQSFGVGFDFIQADARPDRRYLAAGLFVENRLFDWFLLGIGLMAYVPLESPRPTPIGISTKLGWTPQYHRLINPFAVIRADWIFDDRIVGILSANFGISLSLRSRRGRQHDSTPGAPI